MKKVRFSDKVEIRYVQKDDHDKDIPKEVISKEVIPKNNNIEKPAYMKYFLLFLIVISLIFLFKD